MYIQPNKDAETSHQAWLNARNLFVSGFPEQVLEYDLVNIFRPYGPIHACEIMRDPDTNMSRGFGFVKLTTPKHAQDAERDLNGTTVQSDDQWGLPEWTLSIETSVPYEKAEEHAPRARTPPPRTHEEIQSNPKYGTLQELTDSNRLLVTGIPSGVTEDDLVNLFRRFGMIRRCEITRNWIVDESRGFAWIDMLMSVHANAAKKALNGKKITPDVGDRWPEWTPSVHKTITEGPHERTPGRYNGSILLDDQFKFLPDKDLVPLLVAMQEVGLKLVTKGNVQYAERHSIMREHEKETEVDKVRRLIEELRPSRQQEEEEEERAESIISDDEPEIIHLNESLQSFTERLQKRGNVRFGVKIYFSRKPDEPPCLVSADSLIKSSREYFRECFNIDNKEMYRFRTSMERSFTFYDYPPQVVQIFLFWLDKREIPTYQQCHGLITPSTPESVTSHMIVLARCWVFGYDKKVPKLMNAVMHDFIKSLQGPELPELSIDVLTNLVRVIPGRTLLRKAVLEEAWWTGRWELLDELKRSWIFAIHGDVTEARLAYEGRDRKRGEVGTYLVDG
jgi:hypothetical protein